MIGAAPGGAWSTASAEGRSRRLRKATVEGLGVVCAPDGGGVVEVLAPGVGAVVHPGRTLISVVRGIEGRRPSGKSTTICTEELRAGRGGVCAVEEGGTGMVMVRIEGRVGEGSGVVGGLGVERVLVGVEPAHG